MMSDKDTKASADTPMPATLAEQFSELEAEDAAAQADAPNQHTNTPEGDQPPTLEEQFQQAEQPEPAATQEQGDSNQVAETSELEQALDYAESLLDDVAQQAEGETTPSAEPTEAQPEAQPEDWLLPEFKTDGDTEPEPVKNAFNMYPSWYGKESEPEEEVIEIHPVSLEELEQIRNNAYQEGYDEGKHLGHQEGLPEGREQGLAEGREQGHAEGLAQGLEQGQQQIDQLAERWQGLCDALHQPQQQLNQEVEQQVVDLAMALAAEIVKVELRTNPEAVLHSVKQAVTALPMQQATAQISLHPDDLAIVQQAFPQDTLDKKNWQLLADPTIALGDCLVETDLSSVKVDMQATIRQSLEAFIKQNHDHESSSED
ncbi:flagellar assembly protein FliH [Aliagarivorans marinus]|uniref:flagellar assembly protein FliH n=1 Tax=Aliagarivorans marinus TaxID=561965 RepID=UPI000410695F|nr:flagellar assembly protein FliH [Aliagarivorans marinus]